MNCSEAEELIGAYALDALPSDEAAALRAHIAGCPDHASKAAELRAVASTLAGAPDPVPPPARLRERVFAAVAQTPQEAPASRVPLSIDGARRTGGRAPWRSVRPLQAWAALAAAVIAGLLVWNVALQAGDDGARFDATRATSATTLQAHGAAGSGTALYFADEDAVVLVADGIDQLDSTRTYQLWALTSDRPVSLGIMRPDADGHMASVAKLDAGATGIAITVEPAGGSVQPTTEPVFTAELPT
jgi:anti-sigma-K factor RskA